MKKLISILLLCVTTQSYALDVAGVKLDDKGRIEGADFHSALLKVWVGEKPAQADLKQSLLGGR